MPFPRKATLCLLFQITIISLGLAETIRLDYNGETNHNVLRHSVAISDQNTTFGKKGSTLLSREVVSKGRIWSSIDKFTQQVFKAPSTLDWYIADVGTDGDPRSITLQAMFSCIDRGESSAEPISWYVATDLTRKLNTEPGLDGFKKTLVGHASVDDITEQCLKGRHENRDDFLGRRITVHLDKHRGTGVRFIHPPKGPETSVVGDESVFDRLWKLRNSVDPPTVIVWDEKSGVGVVDGVPFDNGFKIWAPESLTTSKTRDYFVHLIPTAALTAHIGFRLQETRVARGESRTSNLLLLLTVWATGLALLPAVWIVGKTYSDILVELSRQMRTEHVDVAVKGMSGWSVGQKAILFGHLAGVTILAAPVAQAVVEGNIDPRAAYEVTSGTSVLYSDTRAGLTTDLENPIAGAVFTCTVWITVRPLDNGFVAALTLSSVIIFFFALLISMRVTKKSSETMRSSRHRWSGFSPWKLLGWVILRLRAVPGRNTRRYKVFVRLRKDFCSKGDKDVVEDRVKEIGLMSSETWRKRAKTYYYRHITRNRDGATREASRNALHDLFHGRHGNGCVALFARVVMDDKIRFNATTAYTTPFGDMQPREWEYVRRGANCESIEWYRTNGRFPSDEALLLTRLGLLKYAKYIAEVRYCEDLNICRYDDDGVKCLTIVPQSKEVSEHIEEAFVDNDDGYPNIWRVDHGNVMCPSLQHEMRHENAEIEWSEGRGGRYYTHYDSGRETIRYYLADRDDLIGKLGQ